MDWAIWRKGMGRLGVIGAVSLTLIGSGAVAIAGGGVEEGESSGGLLHDWIEAQEEIETWSAQFTQTRKLQTLKQPLESSGRVWYKAPDHFRWEVGDPARTIAIRNGDNLWLIYPRLKRAEKYSMSEGRRERWGAALLLLEAGFPQDANELKSVFEIGDLQPVESRVTLMLRPKASRVRDVVRSIEVVVDRADFSLTATEIRFADGSVIQNQFKEGRKNPKLTAQLFRPEVGEDYKVVEPMKP